MSHPSTRTCRGTGGPARHAVCATSAPTLATATARPGDSDPNPDEALRRARGGPAPARTARLVAQVAHHLAGLRPGDRMTEAARMTTALTAAGDAQSARPLLRVLPFPTGGSTRGEYAHGALELAWALGWDEDDNKPWLPRIPGPRTTRLGFLMAEDDRPSIPGQRIPAKVPKQPIRQQAGRPTCCGRPMAADGRQLVCRSCGAWVDTGAFAAAGLSEMGVR